MAEVSGYKNDIFISYTHNDNARIADTPGWVDVFHEALEDWLGKLRGLSNLKIWRDESRMSGNTLFGEAIKEAVSESALFFALNSRNYPNSEYCRKELNWFHQYNSKRPGGLCIGKKLRIFNILLNNIPHQQWSDELGETSGFPMYDAKSNDDLGDFISTSDEQFKKQMRPIVDAVEKILQEFPKDQHIPPTASKSVDKVRVFVANAADSDTLQKFRERIIEEVKDKNAHVFDEIPPPMEMDKHAESVKIALSQAELSIHLFDQLPGRRIIDNKETTYPREQFQIALKSETQKLIWAPADLNISAIEDETQRFFLDNIANGDRETVQYEFVKGSRSDFIAVISQRIDDLSSF